MSADEPSGPPHHKTKKFKDKLHIFRDTKIISSNNLEISGSYLCKQDVSRL